MQLEGSEPLSRTLFRIIAQQRIRPDSDKLNETEQALVDKLLSGEQVTITSTDNLTPNFSDAVGKILEDQQITLLFSYCHKSWGDQSNRNIVLHPGKPTFLTGGNKITVYTPTAEEVYLSPKDPVKLKLLTAAERGRLLNFALG